MERVSRNLGMGGPSFRPRCQQTGMVPGPEDAPEWTGAREEVPALITETFENAGELLARFSDEQLDQGFWFLIGPTDPEFMQTLVDATIRIDERLRALRSFVSLFEQVMAIRCTPHLSHLDDRYANPLNSACYMWWDLLRDQLWNRVCSPLQTEIIATLRDLLAIPHDACRESALHGIGHIYCDNPQCRAELPEIIEEFLTNTPGLRPELVAYAERASVGHVL